jgi:hypothetical protein
MSRIHGFNVLPVLGVLAVQKRGLCVQLSGELKLRCLTVCSDLVDLKSVLDSHVVDEGSIFLFFLSEELL